ncbi:unnamed protein product [Spirodela intermedia]|uniref:Uncharacterized protein n=1 Tax=Spirodela intermedia TaxID=51605 RepID=A0A7I8ILB0_SPIIN|nr:unnamed protein product [Spirodela intermedia]CAA6658195.1 unnamed protein product [Spirodela intermedia]
MHLKPISANQLDFANQITTACCDVQRFKQLRGFFFWLKRTSSTLALGKAYENELCMALLSTRYFESS